MVFSFFKKQPEKMPERPAAKPRPKDTPPEAAAPQPAREEANPLREPLPDLEFTVSDIGMPAAGSAVQKPTAVPATQPAKGGAQDFTIDDFDADDFTESSVMGIDVDQDDDPLQACVEQVVVLYANGQDGAARSLLETFVRSYHGAEGKRFWLLLFDLLQNQGDQAGFEKLGVEYAEACETSPPAWRIQTGPVRAAAAIAGRKVFLQGVVTQDGLLPINELAKIVAAKGEALVDCSKLIGCDDVVAGQLADLLGRARKGRLAVTLVGAEAFMSKLDARLVAGDAKSEDSWRLLLELLQRHGTQDKFEERAVDYAVTFELSPPSWETPPANGKPTGTTPSLPVDDAHYLSGELKNCRFEDLVAVLDGLEHPVLDFSGVTRLDFVSAGQLVNRLAPFKAAGKDIIIRSPNHLVAELMAVVGLNKQARILVPKS